MWFIHYILFTNIQSCAILPHLKFNLSQKGIPEGLPIYNTTETLAEAICCDNRYLGLAEPQYTFRDPSVALFDYLIEGQDYYFYDSQCGLPLFVVPRGRTLNEFKEETNQHGWPSFHDAEIVVQDNTPNIINVSGSSRVISKCGTHLGDNLPEGGYNRYCLDLVCLSGYPDK